MAQLGISELNKEATRLKNAGDLEGAIACLRAAKCLRWTADVHYPIKSWTRLPLFLQAAGRMDEAMVEFQELLDTAEKEIERFHSHNMKQVRNMLTYATEAEIYTAMSRACKREKRITEAEQYESIANKKWEQHQKLFAIDQERRRKAAETRRSRRP